jgi:hypothetical protein
MAYLCEIEPFSAMTNFAFEIVQKISQHPYGGMYPKHLAYSLELKGASRVALREYPDEATARRQVTTHEQALASSDPSEIWKEFCPPNFKDNCRGGTDVRFIGVADRKTIQLFEYAEDGLQTRWSISGRHN